MAATASAMHEQGATAAPGTATHEEGAPAESRRAPIPMEWAAPPLVVQLLAGNPATAIALLPLLNTTDATALRRLHPVVAVAVESMPWCDRKIRVVDVTRWRAAFPVAIAARLVRVDPAVTAATLAGLTYLDVSECASSEMDGVIRLLPPTLRALDVHGCRWLSDAVSFAHLPVLETLDCGGTGIGNSAIATLSPTLRVLQANYCGVSTGADFRHLRALRTSRHESQNVTLCCGNLPSSLEVLELVGFVLKLQGAPFAHFALRTLWLYCCQLPHTALASLPPTIADLTVTTCTGLATSSFPHPPLPTLYLLHCAESDLGDAALASLPPSLLRLTMRGGAAQLTSAASFPPHMPALQVVNMSGTAIGDTTIASLPCSLQELHLENCTSVTPAARLDHLVDLRTLRSSGANLAPSTVAACRARGCNALADGTLRGHGSNKVMSLAALPDGALASGDAGGTVRLWAAGDDGAYHAAGDGLAGQGGEVRALVALQDGRRLAAGVCINEQWRICGSVVVRDLSAVPPTRTTTITFGAGVMALAQLAGDHLAVGCGDSNIHVVDARAGAATGALMAGHTASVTALVMLPDGSMLASGSADCSMRLWDVNTKSCVATLAGHTDAVTALAVLADGKLASGSQDGPVRLWDTASRTCVCEYEAYSIVALAALPGGGLVGGTQTGCIEMWNAAGCKRYADMLFSHTRSVTALVVLPGNRLASASEDGTVRLWQLPPSL